MEPQIIEAGNELIEALSPVYGQAMTGHTVLADGVVQVDYEDGKSILVNYNETEQETAAGVVPAAGWLLIEREG